MRTVKRSVSQFAVIGCGRVVHELHLPAWRGIADAQMVAACDSSETALASFAAVSQNLRCYAVIEDLLSSEQDLDFVVVATPGRTHAPLAARLLEAGLHVLCEKPLAFDAHEAEDLYALADRQGLILTTIHNYLFKENSQAALATSSRRALGDIVLANVRFHSGPLLEEPVRWMRYERVNRILLFDFAYHVVDLALKFLGPLGTLCFVDSEEDDCGLQYVVFGTRHINGARGLFELMLDASCRQAEIEVMGEQGALVLQFFPDGLRHLPIRDNPLSRAVDESIRLTHFAHRHVAQRLLRRLPSRAAGHSHLFRLFIEAIRGKAVNPTPREEVLRTLSVLGEVATRAYRADLAQSNFSGGRGARPEAGTDSERMRAARAL